MIFKSISFLESDSSAGQGARTKKSTACKSTARDDGDSPQPVRRRTKSESKTVGSMESETSVDASPREENFESENESYAQVEEQHRMNQVDQQTDWQHEQSEQSYPQPIESDAAMSAGYEDEEYYGDEQFAGQEQGQYGQNQIVLTLSYSLMNQVRQTARMEGVLPEDILIELVAEGVTRRAFEDAQRPAPSHLMTRTGYVAPDANGNVHQPQLSHHGMQGNHRGNHNGHNNRRFNQNNNRNGNHFQGRNRQNNNFKNKQRNGK